MATEKRPNQLPVTAGNVPVASSIPYDNPITGITEQFDLSKVRIELLKTEETDQSLFWRVGPSGTVVPDVVPTGDVPRTHVLNVDSGVAAGPTGWFSTIQGAIAYWNSNKAAGEKWGIIVWPGSSGSPKFGYYTEDLDFFDVTGSDLKIVNAMGAGRVLDLGVPDTDAGWLTTLEGTGTVGTPHISRLNSEKIIFEGFRFVPPTAGKIQFESLTEFSGTFMNCKIEMGATNSADNGTQFNLYGQGCWVIASATMWSQPVFMGLTGGVIQGNWKSSATRSALVQMVGVTLTDANINHLKATSATEMNACPIHESGLAPGEIISGIAGSSLVLKNMSMTGGSVAAGVVVTYPLTLNDAELLTQAAAKALIAASSHAFVDVSAPGITSGTTDVDSFPHAGLNHALYHFKGVSGSDVRTGTFSVTFDSSGTGDDGSIAGPVPLGGGLDFELTAHVVAANLVLRATVTGGTWAFTAKRLTI